VRARPDLRPVVVSNTMSSPQMREPIRPPLAE